MKRLLSLVALIIFVGAGCATQQAQQTNVPNQNFAEYGFTQAEWTVPATSNKILGEWKYKEIPPDMKMVIKQDGSIQKTRYFNRNMTEQEPEVFKGKWVFTQGTFSVEWSGGAVEKYTDLHLKSDTLIWRNGNNLQEAWIK